MLKGLEWALKIIKSQLHSFSHVSVLHCNLGLDATDLNAQAINWISILLNFHSTILLNMYTIYDSRSYHAHYLLQSQH